MSIHCAVCINLCTKKAPPPLTEDTMYFAHHDHWNYICCPEHANLVREHGLRNTLALLKKTNPTDNAT